MQPQNDSKPVWFAVFEHYSYLSDDRYFSILSDTYDDRKKMLLSLQKRLKLRSHPFSKLMCMDPNSTFSIFPYRIENGHIYEAYSRNTIGMRASKLFQYRDTCPDPEPPSHLLDLFHAECTYLERTGWHSSEYPTMSGARARSLKWSYGINFLEMPNWISHEEALAEQRRQDEHPKLALVST